MRRSVVVLAIASLVTLACRDQEPAFPELYSETEIVSQSRSLASDTALTAVGLRPEAERDDGSASWDRRFRDWKERVEKDAVRRNFELTIANRDRAAHEFRATIEYRGENGIVKTRQLRHIVVPPLTEKTLYGFTRIRRPGDVAALCVVERVGEGDSP